MSAVAPDAVERYMARPYRIELIPDDDEWFVEMPELPGCMSQGQTPEEALLMIRDAQRGWLTVRLEHGLAIPEPAPEPEHRFTGRFSIRVPRDLHRALVTAAAGQGASLNLYVATILAQAVKTPAPASDRSTKRPSDRGHPASDRADVTSDAAGPAELQATGVTAH